MILMFQQVRDNTINYSILLSFSTMEVISSSSLSIESYASYAVEIVNPVLTSIILISKTTRVPSIPILPTTFSPAKNLFISSSFVVSDIINSNSQIIWAFLLKLLLFAVSHL